MVTRLAVELGWPVVYFSGQCGQAAIAPDKLGSEFLTSLVVTIGVIAHEGITHELHPKACERAGIESERGVPPCEYQPTDSDRA